jgi:hypothetical protein
LPTALHHGHTLILSKFHAHLSAIACGQSARNGAKHAQLQHNNHHVHSFGSNDYFTRPYVGTISLPITAHMGKIYLLGNSRTHYYEHVHGTLFDINVQRSIPIFPHGWTVSIRIASHMHLPIRNIQPINGHDGTKRRTNQVR